MSQVLESAVVRIYSKSGKVVGGGCLVDPRHVLTCAHVVAAALGIDRTVMEPPTAEVELDFPRVSAGKRLRARVTFWLPLDPNQSQEDIAGLELLEAPPEATRPARLVTSTELWGHEFRIMGFPENKANGAWASGVLRGGVANGWVQLEDVKKEGYRLEDGFSGAPIWDEELQGVVGIAVAAEKQRLEAKAAFAMPTLMLVAAWPLLQEQAMLQERSIPPCPYRGLLAFREEDARFFFGRETVANELAVAVKRKPLVAVVGASGSGKSSLVFAGLLPKLQLQPEWLVAKFRPGEDPFYNLAEALVPLLEPEMTEVQWLAEMYELAQKWQQPRPQRVALAKMVARIVAKHQSQRLLLVVDQFEELYTLGYPESKQQRFLDVLLAGMAGEPTLCLVPTLRADFLGYALSYRPFADALQGATVMLGPMNREELQAAIAEPAGLLEVRFQAGLVERILEDVASSPGSLPLLEFALAQLWGKQEMGELTHAAYEEIGGVKEALSKYAEDKYEELEEDWKQKVERVFVELIRFVEEEKFTRRLATRSELGERNWKTVQKLAEWRLVVTDVSSQAETVEIVHEALIESWGRLKGWATKNREVMIWRERLQVNWEQWKDRNRDEGALLRGDLLYEAKSKLPKLYEGDMYVELKEYIEKSWEVYEREEKERREKDEEIHILSKANSILEAAKDRANKIIRSGVIVFIVAGLSAIGLLAFSYQRLVRLQTATEVEQVAASALRQFHLSQLDALHSAVRNVKQLQVLVNENVPLHKYPAISPLLALREILDKIKERDRLDEGTSQMKTVRFSPDGMTIATAGREGVVKLWMKSSSEIADWQANQNWKAHDGGILAEINDLAFSPDGKTIITASGDDTIRFWRRNGELERRVDLGLSVIRSISFSPDGEVIAVAGDYSPVKLLDALGNERGKLEGHGGGVNRVNFSPDGQKLVTAGQDGTVQLWKRSGEAIETLVKLENQDIRDANFSPDGQAVIVTGRDKALVINLSDKTQVRLEDKTQVRLEKEIGIVTTAAFSPDGGTIATSGSDGIIRLWNRAGQELEQLQGHRGMVWQVSFSPDGEYLMSAGRDGTSRLWQLSRRSSQPEFRGFEDDVNAIRFSPDGRTIVAGGDEGVVRIWTTDGQEQANWVANQRGVIWSLDVSPDGKKIATVGDEETPRIWDISGQLIATLRDRAGRGHKYWVEGVRFSPDGNQILTSGADGTPRLWTSSGELLAVLEGHQGVVSVVDFSPDGKTIGTAAWDGGIALWNATSGKELLKWQGHDAQVRGIAFSPDGRAIATADDQSTVKVWNLSGKKQLEIYTYQLSVYELAISPDGNLIATGGTDGTVKIWDLEGRQLAEFTNDQGAIWGMSFSPDGKFIAAGGDAGSLHLWRIDTPLDQLLDRGCEWLKGYSQRRSLEDGSKICMEE